MGGLRSCEKRKILHEIQIPASALLASRACQGPSEPHGFRRSLAKPPGPRLLAAADALLLALRLALAADQGNLREGAGPWQLKKQLQKRLFCEENATRNIKKGRVTWNAC